MVAFDHVCYTLAALHPGLDQLGKHLEDPLAGARALLLKNGRGYATKPQPKVGRLPGPPPLLKIHGFNLWSEWFGFYWIDGVV